MYFDHFLYKQRGNLLFLFSISNSNIFLFLDFSVNLANLIEPLKKAYEKNTDFSQSESTKIAKDVGICVDFIYQKCILA